MQFASFSFLYFFFPISLAAYHAVPKHWKPMTMLIISAIFILSGGIFSAGVLLLLTAGTFGAGLLLEKIRASHSRSALLLGTAVMFEFAALILLRSDWMQSWKVNWIHGADFFPFGFAFFVLQSIGYLVDVHRGKCHAEHNWQRLSLFLLFYPRLIMGPVVQYSTVEKTLCVPSFSLSQIGAGFFRVLLGLAKKLILANWLVQIFDTVMLADTALYSAWIYWIGIFAKFLSLYFSLSGYADMAIGTALCYGVKLPESYGKTMFYPGIALFAEQWNRTVVQWFSHYVGTHFHGRNRFFHVFAVVITWGCVGLWYGFRLTTMLWGMGIGLCIGLEYLFGNKNRYRGFRYAGTLFLLCVSMVLFVLPDMPHVLLCWKKLFQITEFTPKEADFLLLKGYILVLLVGVYAATGNLHTLLRQAEKQKWFRWIRLPGMLLAGALLLLVCTAVLVTGNGSTTADLLL